MGVLFLEFGLNFALSASSEMIWFFAAHRHVARRDWEDAGRQGEASWGITTVLMPGCYLVPYPIEARAADAAIVA